MTDEPQLPPPDVPPLSPPPAVPSSAGPDATGAGATIFSPGKVEELKRASVAATAQFVTERKTRGRDKKPRRLPPQCQPRLPLGEMGNGPDPTPVPEGAPLPLPVEWETPQPAFDSKTAKALVEVGLRLLNDGAAAVVRAIALKETGDVQLAETASKEARMTDDVRAAVEQGALLCAEKYAIQTKYGPEIMLFGGLAAWLLPVTLQVKSIRAKGAELRGPQTTTTHN